MKQMMNAHMPDPILCLQLMEAPLSPALGIRFGKTVVARVVLWEREVVTEFEPLQF